MNCCNGPCSTKLSYAGLNHWVDKPVCRQAYGRETLNNEMFKSNTGQGEEDRGPEWKVLEKVVTASFDEQKKARRWGIFFKLLTFLYLFILLLLMFPIGQTPLAPVANEHVGLVKIDGIISADSPANANSVAASLRKAFDAENTKAVILAINSPGGSPVQAGYINDEITRLREIHPEKKIYAVIADLGASGGYYIAVAADEIYADKASLVGSIGVISAGFGFTGLMEKLGTDRRSYTAGTNKAFLDPYVMEKEDERAFWEEVLSVTHAQFVEVVKQGRGERLLDDPEIFSGLIWSGEQALAKGLVDGLGSAGYVAREVIGVEDIVDYTIQPNPFEEFAKRLGMQFSLALTESLSPQLLAR